MNDELITTNDGMLSLDGATVMSKNSKVKMNETLAKVDQAKLAGAMTLEDSVNLTVKYNNKKNITDNTGGE